MVDEAVSVHSGLQQPGHPEDQEQAELLKAADRAMQNDLSDIVTDLGMAFGYRVVRGGRVQTAPDILVQVAPRVAVTLEDQSVTAEGPDDPIVGYEFTVYRSPGLRVLCVNCYKQHQENLQHREIAIHQVIKGHHKILTAMVCEGCSRMLRHVPSLVHLADGE